MAWLQLSLSWSRISRVTTMREATEAAVPQSRGTWPAREESSRAVLESRNQSHLHPHAWAKADTAQRGKPWAGTRRERRAFPGHRNARSPAMAGISSQSSAQPCAKRAAAGHAAEVRGFAPAGLTYPLPGETSRRGWLLTAGAGSAQELRCRCLFGTGELPPRRTGSASRVLAIKQNYCQQL